MGHYSEFYEAEEERRCRDERNRRLKHVVTVEQETEYHQTNVKLYGLRKLDGFVPTRQGER